MAHTTQLQRWLDLLRNGDGAARDAVIGHACERLRTLARKMLRAYPGVRRWEETGDVLQNALVRLSRSLVAVRPESPQQFYGLAATQIRRELLDLAKHYYGAEGVGANHHSDGGIASTQKQDSVAPDTMEAWSRFHELTESLPVQERDVVVLLWYAGMPQPEAAEALGISLATLKRRWQSARLRLRDLQDDWVIE